jgi:L-2-hydroxyglutarate oxidase
LETHCKIAVVGGGILGTSIAYFLSSLCGSKILVIEQEKNVALHTSSRNTGKVHAPFLYDPLKKKLFAKAAFLGYDMWHRYSDLRQVLFKQDGVMEVAVNEEGIDRVQKYMEWGVENGLQPEKEIKILQKEDVKKMEPSVNCHAALYCSRDASADYGLLTRNLFYDAQSFECRFLLGHRLRRVTQSHTDGLTLTLQDGEKQKTINTEFLINVAGGNALDIAHSMNLAHDYTDFHFRGEYWQAPTRYQNLTKLSIYSVPTVPEYPFLDPHWIVRIDGRREIGPNAVPVFGPYAYNWKTNLKYFIPKTFESLKARGAQKILVDTQFLRLVSNELKSSVSKSSMINRVKRFLPQIKISDFSKKGTSGIRSILVNKDGRFVPDTLILKDWRSMHVLNYNSPGATGALPVAAMIADQLFENGVAAPGHDQPKSKTIFDFREVAHNMST